MANTHPNCAHDGADDLTNDAPRFSERSLDCEGDLAAGVFASSVDAGWTSLLLERRRSAPIHEPFESGVTPDQRIIVMTRGSVDIAAFGGGRWRQAIYQTGSAGMTPGGEASRLRWSSRRKGDTSDTAHLYLPQAFIDEAVDHYRRAGTPHREGALARLAFDDPVVASTVLALTRAMETGASDLYAQTAAQWLTVHLLERHSAWGAHLDEARDPGIITDARLQRTLEFMTTHLAEPMTLERLASEAGVSKFHFARLFRDRIGESPVGHLTSLRMEAARRMLATTDLPVSSIGGQCGYPRPAHFNTAFARRFGIAPGAFRAQVRAAR